MKDINLSFFNTAKYKLVLSLSMSVFFYLFLTFFLPFGVDNYNPFHEYTLAFLLEIFYFFGVVLSFSLLNEFLLRPLFIRKATRRGIVLWSLWTVILLSTAVFFTYNILGNWHDFHLKSYLGFIVNCTSVFIFPIVGTFFFFRYRSLQQHIDHILTNKEEPITGSELITFNGQGSKDQITLSVSSFLYGRAQDNYVELYYLKQQKPVKFLIRASLGKLSESIEHAAIARCHRSYMVNLFHVNEVSGSRTEINLFLDPLENPVPVSRSYRETIMNRLRVLKNFD